MHDAVFVMFRGVRKIAKSDYYLPSYLSVRPSAWNSLPLDDFLEVCYMSIFRISVEKIQVSLQSDKNNDFKQFIVQLMHTNYKILRLLK